MFSRKYTAGSRFVPSLTLTLQTSSVIPSVSPVGTFNPVRYGLIRYFFSSMVPYLGIKIDTSAPSFLSALGKKHETCAKPPIVAKGATSAQTNRILRGWVVIYAL